MKINFFKMQAQGNDYCYCDLNYNDEDFITENASEIAQKMSERRFSVGADGLIILKRDNFCDAKIIIYNSDGTRASVCGNGLRCVAYYLSKKLSARSLKIATDAGLYDAVVYDNYVSVNMKKPEIIENQKGAFVKLKQINDVIFFDFVRAGNKHLVLYYGNKKVDNGLIDRFLSNNRELSDEYNLEFIYKRGKEYLIRVFERGSGETLCCGSGAVASYYSLKSKGLIADKKASLNFRGGKVFLETIKENVYLGGEVSYLYEGVFYYD